MGYVGRSSFNPSKVTKNASHVVEVRVASERPLSRESGERKGGGAVGPLSRRRGSEERDVLGRNRPRQPYIGRRIKNEGVSMSVFERIAVGLALLLIGVARTAIAQVLPPINVPELPVHTPVDIDRTLNRTLEAADPRRLRELRRLRVSDLLRANRQVLEADPRGEPILRSEV